MVGASGESSGRGPGKGPASRSWPPREECPIGRRDPIGRFRPPAAASIGRIITELEKPSRKLMATTATRGRSPRPPARATTTGAERDGPRSRPGGHPAATRPSRTSPRLGARSKVDRIDERPGPRPSSRPGPTRATGVAWRSGRYSSDRASRQVNDDLADALEEVPDARARIDAGVEAAPGHQQADRQAREPERRQRERPRQRDRQPRPRAISQGTRASPSSRMLPSDWQSTVATRSGSAARTPPGTPPGRRAAPEPQSQVAATAELAIHIPSWLPCSWKPIGR